MMEWTTVSSFHTVYHFSDWFHLLSEYTFTFPSCIFFFFLISFNLNLFNWRLITLQYCIGSAIHQHESATGVHMFRILNPISYLPPRTIPLGHPSVPAPRILY